MKIDTPMRQFRRPEFMESWIGKGFLATVIAGAAIGIMLPLPLRDALTYWTVFGIIAGVMLLGFFPAYNQMVFFRVILPNLG